MFYEGEMSMRNDVQTLIAALTTDRDSLTRAIESLQQISSLVETTPTPDRHRAPMKKAKRLVYLAAPIKAAIIARMALATNQSETARELSQEYGTRVNTIMSNWKKWRHAAAASDNGAQAVQ